MKPDKNDASRVSAIGAWVKYPRFSTGSAARRSASTNTGSSTTNANRNGHTSSDLRLPPRSKKSMLVRPYSRLMIIATSNAVPIRSSGATVVSR